MGDTDIFSDMALIAELYERKIAMVPIGDRFTMGARTAALAVKRYFKLDAVIRAITARFPLSTRRPTSSSPNEGHATEVIVPEKGIAVSV